MTSSFNSSIPQTPPLPLIASFPAQEGNRCSQSRQSVCAKTDAAVSEVPQGLSDEERDDEMTFQGKWVEEFAELRAKFDVKAQAVRRRTCGN
jgi:hypothetical protein